MLSPGCRPASGWASCSVSPGSPSSSGRSSAPAKSRLPTLALAVVALLSITVGTLYQKRYVEPCDVRTASAVQMLAGLVVCVPLAWLEPGVMDWHVDLVAAMAWSVGVLTLGGSSLLYLLIQRGEATAVTSLLYLVPPCTALMAWALFGEACTPPMMLGMALTVVGVAIVVRNPRDAPIGAAP
jgi:drug/metabolite transporter (DMT)-like permease